MHENGRDKNSPFCRLSDLEWDDHRSEIQVITENNKKCAEILDKIYNDMLNVFMGKEIVPADVARTLLAEQRDSYKIVIRSLCWTFGVIIVVLIGVKSLFPLLFNGAG